MSILSQVPSSLIFNRVPYVPPSWLLQRVDRSIIPTSRIQLGRFPTPVHHFVIPGIEHLNLTCFIKRDDLSSFDLSGNKVRKLEFLLADATQEDRSQSDLRKYDCVVTIGGIQSNHARATAVASRQLGLDPYLILRGKEEPDDVGLTGNLLLDRMVGSNIRLVTPGTYARIGSNALTQKLAAQLTLEGRRPYVIPVGGSNSLGAFGYVEAVREMLEQGLEFDHLVFACGSGGTAAGLAIGVHLAGMAAKVHAVCVCDTPDYFYNHINEVLRDWGLADSGLEARQLCTVYPGQGVGYARSTSEELRFIAKVAASTGIVLDPVYSGKALFNLANIAACQTEVFMPGQRVLFLHTGGTLGLYDKAAELLPLLPQGQVTRMEV